MSSTESGPFVDIREHEDAAGNLVSGGAETFDDMVDASPLREIARQLQDVVVTTDARGDEFGEDRAAARRAPRWHKALDRLDHLAQLEDDQSKARTKLSSSRWNRGFLNSKQPKSSPPPPPPQDHLATNIGTFSGCVGRVKERSSKSPTASKPPVVDPNDAVPHRDLSRFRRMRLEEAGVFAGGGGPEEWPLPGREEAFDAEVMSRPLPPRRRPPPATSSLASHPTRIPRVVCSAVARSEHNKAADESSLEEPD